MRKTIEDGLNFEPTSEVGTVTGDIWVDISDSKLKYYSQGQTKTISTFGPSDIPQTEFTFLDAQSNVAVTGLNFSNNCKYFKASVYINRASSSESVELIGVNASGGWQISTVNPLGDDTGVDFSINAGQVQYSSTSTGVGGIIVFKAQAIEYTI